MGKLVIAITILLALSGCVSQPDTQAKAKTASFSATEHMLLQTSNHAKLIKLYKDELAKGESPELRVKLIEQYILSDDIESASFQLQSLDRRYLEGAHGQFLSAQVSYRKALYQEALEHGKQSLALNQNQPETHNLMGLTYAELKQFHQARYHFYQARRYYYDDIIVKNNLAVIDLILGDYQAAVSRLRPIYINGQADEKVMVNLAMAHANLGQFDQVKQLLEGQYSHEQIELIYHGLRTVSATKVQLSDLSISESEVRNAAVAQLGGAL